MTKAQYLLRLYPSVCNDSHKGWHDYGHEPLYGVEIPDVCSKADTCQISSHTCQICAPHGKFQEIEYSKSDFGIHINPDYLIKTMLYIIFIVIQYKLPVPSGIHLLDGLCLWDGRQAGEAGVVSLFVCLSA